MRNFLKTKITITVAFLIIPIVIYHFSSTVSKNSAGKAIFFDKNLSAKQNQSCAVCHGKDVGWTGPDEYINKHGSVYEGSLSNHFGNRKPPSCAYASFSPVLSFDSVTGFYGGVFWDGRATGWKLGNPVADQAQGPPLNPLEQALADSSAMVQIVCSSVYADTFKNEWADNVCSKDVSFSFSKVALSILSFESSNYVNRFNSKFDRVRNGQDYFTTQELQGYKLFTGKGNCTQCHTISSSPDTPSLFTNNTYHNIGIPRNPENPYYHMDTVYSNGAIINQKGAAWVDSGLGGFLARLTSDSEWRNQPFVSKNIKTMSDTLLMRYATQNYGKQRVPTLRNVNLKPSDHFVKAYSHNGYFKSLKSLIHFYNTRDTKGYCSQSLTEKEALTRDCWPEPEVSANLNRNDTGKLGLSSQEEDALVEFLNTLSDDVN